MRYLPTVQIDRARSGAGPSRSSSTGRAQRRRAERGRRNARADRRAFSTRTPAPAATPQGPAGCSQRCIRRGGENGCAASPECGIRSLALTAAAFALVAAPPAPNAPLPRGPERTAAALIETTGALDAAIGKWLATRSSPPRDVVLHALYQQRLYRRLARDARLARGSLARLPAPLAKVARDLLSAHRGLYVLTPPIPAPRIKVGASPPVHTLLGYYREAQRRFHVSWNVLAAVHFVESKFGKIRSTSAAGAQGPMQFMPATWRQYGLGGNVHDPRDAILGAANYLRASGAPRDLRGALYAYNHSSAYVDAVLRYARRMQADRRMYFALYCWQVFVKTTGGDRRVTGPGLP